MALELTWEDYNTGATGNYWMIEGIDFNKFSSKLNVRLNCYTSKEVREREGSPIAQEFFSLDINDTVVSPLLGDLYTKIKDNGAVSKQLNSAAQEEDLIYKDLDFSLADDI